MIFTLLTLLPLALAMVLTAIDDPRHHGRHRKTSPDDGHRRRGLALGAGTCSRFAPPSRSRPSR